jgi:CheY-like chemotaxis protein
VADNELTREGLAVILRGGSYAVALGTDGRRALEVLRAGPPPDLTPTDLLMPALGG